MTLLLRVNNLHPYPLTTSPKTISQMSLYNSPNVPRQIPKCPYTIGHLSLDIVKVGVG